MVYALRDAVSALSWFHLQIIAHGVGTAMFYLALVFVDRKVFGAQTKAHWFPRLFLAGFFGLQAIFNNCVLTTFENYLRTQAGMKPIGNLFVMNYYCHNTAWAMPYLRIAFAAFALWQVSAIIVDRFKTKSQQLALLT